MLNKNTLSKHVQQSHLLNSIFSYDDPDIVADILQLELNSIINSIAPSKIVQYRKDYIPYYNPNILQELELNKSLLNKAIYTNKHDDWLEFKNFRNTLDKKIRNAKSEYLEKNFADKKCQWKFLKKFNNRNKQHPPNNISHNG